MIKKQKWKKKKSPSILPQLSLANISTAFLQKRETPVAIPVPSAYMTTFNTVHLLVLANFFSLSVCPEINIKVKE